MGLLKTLRINQTNFNKRNTTESTMRLFAFPLLIACLLPTLLSAQELDFMRMMRSASNREYHKNVNRERYRALWNGNGAVISSMPLWQSEEFRQQLDFSPEQFTQLDFMFSKEGSMGHWYRTKAQTDPVLAQMLAEHDPLNAEMRKDPYGENTPPETMRIYQEQLRNMTAYYYTATQKDVEKLLTPEQMQAVREYELAMMGEIPILNPSMFECLDLTEEQKTQMEAIKQTMEPEFNQIVEELVEMEDALQEWKFDLFEKVGIKFDGNGQPVDEYGNSLMNDREAAERKGKEMESELLKNIEMQARMKQINERASGFMRGFKFEMFDVLTDEQMEKLQRIIDNPPEFVKKRRDQMQKARTGREEKDKWQPGPDSWRPGDPIPEEYLQQRPERRFPKRQ